MTLQKQIKQDLVAAMKAKDEAKKSALRVVLGEFGRQSQKELGDDAIIRILKKLIKAEKEGLYVKYSLADEMVCEFFRSMRVLAQHRLAEIEMIKGRFLEGKEGMEPVNRDDLLKRIIQGDVTVLDVRPVEEYRAGHIPGALSVQLSHLKSILAKLPTEQEIVAYCRGPYCVLAVQAVEVLRRKGFNAFRLEESVQDWRAMGLPVEIGD